MFITRSFFAAIFMAILVSFRIVNAFESEMNEEQIAAAIGYGKKHKGMDVFKGTVIKNACFGKYPELDSGLIMSKYIELAIVSAMNAVKEKETTADDINEIQSADFFKVIVLVLEEGIQTPGGVQITLKQGLNNILPQKTEFGRKHKDGKQSVIGVFRYDKIDTYAKTEVIIKTRGREKTYKIDFSVIK
ncbi:hypothetical protein KsCSTR_46520 [Candidatus Kuenenia stuttgartiensis]|jgi:hypothetical protein|uniref:Uncharacterized protein n=1 Tax=Kuenenia stuttgartiensis TaxID=174633 RepID=Q1PW80_KUEST|nr:hypothetical protein [Candidatus Kuenenia stuttgartiensis]MCZ7562417.1 hypothetical protein [Burkholderiales bacterium]QII14030.1 hypothetical protein KsCSTR_46520 [Candidatus Kuenenia stuttgartiensis]CAJ71487.1 unknown protein [Candidatus Kuenenia stuttgartiensis]